VFKLQYLYVDPGAAVAQLFEVLRYKPAGRGFDSQWYQWIFFHWHNPGGRTMALESTQSPGGVNAAGAYG
jgi:hypothetical protein